MIGTRSELINRLGQEYKALYEKYPEGDSHAWRPLALGIAIAALAEEEYQMDWRDLRKKMRSRARMRGDVSTLLDKRKAIERTEGRHLRGCPGCGCAYWCDCASGEDCDPACSTECEESVIELGEN